MPALKSLLFGTLVLGIDAQCSQCYTSGGITFVNSLQTWSNARLTCGSFGLDLAKITSAEENAAATSLFSTHNTQGGSAWIGLNDGQSEGTYVWPDLTPATYSNYASGEPNNWGGNEDCMALRTNGQWNDLPCSRTRVFLCTPFRGIGANGDPHLSLPHGGRADFRGEHKALYNFLSAKNFALNVMTELADFDLHEANHPRHKSVHGSFLTQAHVVARTSTGKIVRVSYWADAISQAKDPDGFYFNIGWANGTVDSEPAFTLDGAHKDAKIVDDIALEMGYSSLHVLTPEFEVVVSPHHFRLERNVVGLHHRLDIKIKPRVAEAAFAVAPHGIIGQGWDGDDKAIDGEQDAWPISGEFTTYAMAKGAIEGTPNEYKVATPYATDFKYSRFDATSAERRNVAKLVAAGELNAPKTVYGGETVGTTEQTEEHM